MEVKFTSSNLYEMKTVAGLITFKICRVCFMANFPLDSISHFKKHIDIFRNRNDPLQLEFEHKAWMSKQFALFANLFEQAVGVGLTPSQTQHPGYYFYEGAIEARNRQKLGRKLSTTGIKATPELEAVLKGSTDADFFGSRCFSLDPEGEYNDLKRLVSIALQSQEDVPRA